jgi:glucokinase
VESSYVIAVDVGGTSMKGGLATRAGEVPVFEGRPTGREEGPDAAVAHIRGFVSDLAARGAALYGTPPAAVGLAVPGLVDEAHVTAVYSANIGWRSVPGSAFVGDLAVPVALGHDVRTGGVAESVLGAGRHADDFLFLPIGTGIAGAMILRGAPYGGSQGWGGEIGHIPVWPDGEPCACGQRGCLETYASAASISRRHGAGLPAEEVLRLALEGEAAAVRVWDEATEALGIALATYTLLLDPSLVVVGGGLAGSGEHLLAPVRTALAARLSFRPPPQVVTAALGVRAGMLGSAVLAWRAAGHPSAGADWPPPAVA